MMIPARTDRHRPPATSLVPFLPAPTRLDVIGPMLGDLETATTAGQRYLMGKILTQLREGAGTTRRRLSEQQCRIVGNTLAALEHESEKLMPNADAFVRDARRLTHVLSPA